MEIERALIKIKQPVNFQLHIAKVAIAMAAESWICMRNTTLATNPCKFWIFFFKSFAYTFNPLSPNIHIQILQTHLHTSLLTISWENLIKDQSIFSMVIILLILITLSLDSVWILVGETCCWPLSALKGLRAQIACYKQKGDLSPV